MAPSPSDGACFITRPGKVAGLAETVVPMTAPPVAVTFPVVVSDATEISPAVALIASHWFSAADQTTKIVSPVDRGIALMGTPLFPIIWPLPALETTIGFVALVAVALIKYCWPSTGAGGREIVMALALVAVFATLT